MKMRFKRFLSGFMAVATLASVIVQPVTVSASELEPETTSFEQQYPELQYVQDTLDEDEIVKAKDIEIPYGEEFEVEVDLSGIEGVNEKKVKVLFHEAKSEAGTDFDAHTPDTYKAVYAVEPVSGHPAYRVSRNITVKEPETEAQTKSSSENTAGEGNAGETEDSGNADEDADSDGSKEIVTDLTDEQEVTTDEESGLAVSEVMDQAAENGIDLYSMEEGEAVTFMAKGDVILKADTVIEEQATDKEGKLTFTADLPLGYTYYVKETSPAPGFATTDQVQEFTFEYGGADKETLSYVFTFEDEPTTVEFTKTSLTDGKEIEGAKLKVTDESGNTVDEWTSGKEPHIIKELTAGKKYTMTETLPADGYVTAESITFTVEDTGEVQKVEMKDDVTKVQISKTDISGKELPGAKLTILDKDGKTVESWTSEKKPHYIEMLPIGEYILREETAPDGYLVAEDVKFTVKDTGEIQKVVMKDEAKPEETPTETPTETPETTPTPETKTTEETKKSTSPKTGDNTPILFWILLAGAGMAGLGGTVILRKKKK